MEREKPMVDHRQHSSNGGQQALRSSTYAPGRFRLRPDIREDRRRDRAATCDSQPSRTRYRYSQNRMANAAPLTDAQRFGRRGTALLAALFVMSISSAVVLAVLSSQTSQYAALSNTVAYDEARYLAEAGTAHALALLESDFSYRGTVPRTEFPRNSNRYYSALVEDGSNGTVIVTGTGESSNFVRTVSLVVKQGG
jgi:hypothetical protein